MKKPQNKSHAVMARRFEPLGSRDDFPTPPWATRALIEHVLHKSDDVREMTCLEPACGAGHMSKVLVEYFSNVCSSDAFDESYGVKQDFLDGNYLARSFDWVITNPPFNLAEQFVIEALRVARVGVAVLTRTVFIESSGRYRNLFEKFPPKEFAQFCERVPMVKGRLDKKASTATGYAWLTWGVKNEWDPKLVWIPPCRKLLERPNDYDSAPVQNPDKILSGKNYLAPVNKFDTKDLFV